MRNIQADHPIKIDGVLKRQDVQDCTIVDISVGHDDKIYILLSEKVPDRIRGMFVDTQANTGYHVIALNVNWHTGELLSEECCHLGIHVMNFHFVQPLGDANFRGSKAVFWDNANRIFAVELCTM